jgi:hypothetical protein
MTKIEKLKQKLEENKKELAYVRTLVKENEITVWLDSWLYADFHEYECIELFYDVEKDKITYENTPKMQNVVNGDEIRRPDIHLIKKIIEEVNEG